MSRYQFTTQAQQDLIRIRRFTLEHWGSKQSMSYLEELKKTVKLLSEMPLMGRNCSEDLGKDIYRFLYGSHVIYYLTMPGSIIIIAILHQSMVPENHLGNRL
ncbi:TPA: type II toxin-antitoxin system RelE/ParE family toxin [Legionella pneumophila]|uniref:type II toxin-antitoxin system RelE/ParE family toxin n=1 Tax=Legionella anisa TaxID=28082 RepID=UPI0003453AA3|nr:type II toxin-antitoxin system RelE/ParE family toxin [Legionella anisa]AWN75938.1 type II toxin-antitoxin system RelE/ParE family toxin [Legionella anisa]MCW8426786.1 type II toxin-antitoxin system RelE/ParE family toxin [Legionella anisa]MCW8449546.1 type II toxin-antitoxin system RelE/ParE family toxin [Legionella anisa]MDT0817440.1 type II toxin-antitoxin system RelE/ParE family toxin [Staphylococcus pseudintermedius]